MITYQDFEKVDIRVGEITEAKILKNANKAFIKLKIDFGKEIGIKKSCAQLTKNYSPSKLTGRLVLAVINFPSLQIGPAVSEVLVLGVPDEEGEPTLISPDKQVSLGGKLY